MEIFKLTPEDMKEDPSLSTPDRGEPVVLSLSAYDVPNSFTVTSVNDSIRIEFGYIDREEAEHRAVDERLTVLLGKNSGKVLGFVVKPDAQRPREITIRIVHGVDAQMSRATRPNQRMNYELIKRVVKKRLESVLAER